MSKMYMAEVRNIKDPWKSGRVQVRVYGAHDNEQKVKDSDLPWAMPMQPVTSAATGKVGTVPTGPLVGSRVMVMFLDDAKQYPVIVGTYARAAQPKDPKDNTGGEEGNKPESRGVDLPSSGNPQEKGNVGRAPHNKALGGKPLNTNQDKYNEAQYVENGEGPKGVKTAREKFAPNADKPTTAAADPKLKLPEAIKSVDPAGISQVLRQMFTQLSQVRDVMDATSNVGHARMLTNALYGALVLLASKHGFTKVITIFERCLADNGIEKILVEYRQIVTDALLMIVRDAGLYGEQQIPVRVVPAVTHGNVVPSVVSTTVPDLYVRQFYVAGEEPFEGYIEWLGPENQKIYTWRTANDKPYQSVTEYIEAETERALATDIEVYVKAGKTTTDDLNTLLQKHIRNVQNIGIEATLGKNSSDNSASILASFLGVLGQTILKNKEQHLPQSVLNQGSINKSLDKYAKSMALLKKKKDKSGGAFTPPQLSELLGSAASMVSAMSSKGSSQSTMNVTQNLLARLNKQ